MMFSRPLHLIVGSLVLGVVACGGAPTPPGQAARVSIDPHDEPSAQTVTTSSTTPKPAPTSAAPPTRRAVEPRSAFGNAKALPIASERESAESANRATPLNGATAEEPCGKGSGEGCVRQGASPRPADAEGARDEARNDPTEAGIKGGVPGTNVHVASMTADGMEITGLACNVDGGLGLFGPIVIAATVAKQRSAFAKCGATEPFSANWSTAGGRVTRADVKTGDTKRDTCVKRALMEMRAAEKGQCAATLRVVEMKKRLRSGKAR